jgi:hypothetical protein
LLAGPGGVHWVRIELSGVCFPTQAHLQEVLLEVREWLEQAREEVVCWVRTDLKGSLFSSQAHLQEALLEVRGWLEQAREGAALQGEHARAAIKVEKQTAVAKHKEVSCAVQSRRRLEGHGGNIEGGELCCAK